VRPYYSNGLPDDHPLRPLEDRLLELDDDAGVMHMWTGNCIAALRVFAGSHPSPDTSPVDDGAVRDIHCDGESGANSEDDLVAEVLQGNCGLSRSHLQGNRDADSGCVCRDESAKLTDSVTYATPHRENQPSGGGLSTIPLPDQLAYLTGYRIECAIDDIIDDLLDPEFRKKIAEMCEAGLIEGYDEHGDSICHLSEDEARHEAFCEIRDAVNYKVFGRMCRKLNLD